MTSISIASDSPDVSKMSKDELIAHNLKVVEAHFHNENPESVEKALALYAPSQMAADPHVLTVSTGH